MDVDDLQRITNNVCRSGKGGHTGAATTVVLATKRTIVAELRPLGTFAYLCKYVIGMWGDTARSTSGVYFYMSHLHSCGVVLIIEERRLEKRISNTPPTFHF